MKKRIHAYFSGKVQGVGFRFTVLRIAEDLKICGWVKNLSDLKVEVLAEAEEDGLREFLAQIQEHFARYILDVDLDWSDPTNEFQDFGVKF